MERILKSIPSLFQVKKGMLLYDLFKGISKEFESIERGIEYSFSAHMVTLSDRDKMGGENEEALPFNLKKIAILFDIQPDANESANAFRKRLKDLIGIYLSGLGTVEAILKMTVLNYQFDLSKMVLTRQAEEHPFVTTAGVEEAGEVTLFKVMENPLRLKRHTPSAIYNGIIFEILNEGLFDATPVIEIITQEKGVAYPVISNLTTGQQLIFKGIIPEHSVFRAVPDKDGLTYDIRIGNTFLGSEQIQQGHFFDEGTFDRGRFAESGKTIVFPRGVSHLRVDLKRPLFEEAIFDVSGFDNDASGQFDLKRMDQCAFPPKAPFGRISFSWLEREPASFKVVVPFTLFKGEPVRTIHLKRLIDGIKPAGIASVILSEHVLGKETALMGDELKGIETMLRNKEKMKSLSKFKELKLQDKSRREYQEMTDGIKFIGMFDTMRFETSVFD